MQPFHLCTPHILPDPANGIYSLPEVVRDHHCGLDPLDASDDMPINFGQVPAQVFSNLLNTLEDTSSLGFGEGGNGPCAAEDSNDATCIAGYGNDASHLAGEGGGGGGTQTGGGGRPSTGAKVGGTVRVKGV